METPASVTQRITGNVVRELAAEVGFDAAGVTAVGPVTDFGRFEHWTERGLAGEMRYLTDHRAELRRNPEPLLPGARSVICVGLVYNGPQPYSTEFTDTQCSWISRYAWGEDYHDVIRTRLERLANRLLDRERFEWRACVDTAPLLERSLARQAGLGWIGRNTCLISQQLGSWMFLGELLTTLDLEPNTPPPDRCGTCTRCIDACPTDAIVPRHGGGYELDARLCISYFTIELRGAIPQEHRPGIGRHVFGCDICQDVCPWNRKAARTRVNEFAPGELAPRLEQLAALSEEEFRGLFRKTPVSRARYRGFLRNVAVAMGNSGRAEFSAALEKLAASEDAVVAEHARWGLARIGGDDV